MDYGDERLPERFWRKVEIRETGCWEWTGYTAKTGYGQIRVAGKAVGPHTLTCAAEHGPKPEGKRLAMHSCDNPPCVNPEHLKWGSDADNQADMAAKNRGRKATVTHCGAGHEFTEENTYIAPSRKTRQCRECHRAWWRDWNKRRQEPGYVPDRKGRKSG